VTVIITVVPTADHAAVDPTASRVIVFVETVARLAGRWVWKRLKCDPLFDFMAQNVGIANLEDLPVFDC
jgi:hypothetical protein